jgi:hypothetical protein
MQQLELVLGQRKSAQDHSEATEGLT